MSSDQTILSDALRSPDAYPHETSAIELIETHISWVLLTGRYAYKIKKPVQLPFVDFSTLDRREHFCHEELRLNSRLAPEIYLDVVPIGGTQDKPRIASTPPIEFAVRMHQFPFEATADRLIEAGSLAADELLALAVRIADFHQSLEPEATADPASAILENLDELLRLACEPETSVLEPLADRMRDQVHRLRPALSARIDTGAIRECHGDLHLGNVARFGERLVPFDCLEFDRTLRTVDVIDEVAFLYMDLASHDRRDLAFAFLNRYLESTGDYAGLRLLRLYAAHRALVRAKVALIAASAAADRYLRTAESMLADSQPQLLITVGLSGSGKTTVARKLAQALGSVHVRSDIERKRLSGVDSLTDAGAKPDRGIYRPAVTDATYDALQQAAEAALDGGLTVIVDATFINRDRRKLFSELAATQRATFRILHCTASEETLRERIRQRRHAGTDPSDADESVLANQLKRADPLSNDEELSSLVIDTERAIDYAEITASVQDALAFRSRAR